MKRALVTGATGKLGHAIVSGLLAEGVAVRALVRNPERARALMVRSVEFVVGDVTEPATLRPAAEGCDVVFNAMGLAEQWLADAGRFHRVNAVGTANVADAAVAAGVPRFVHTSTMDVFDAAEGESFDERRLAVRPKGTPYERSKQRAEDFVLARAGGTEVVVVNPAGIYGPGPSSGPDLQRDLFAPLLAGRLPALPPGGAGFVLAESAAAAHLLAALHGRSGERYLICDGYATMKEFARMVVETGGRGRIPPTLPRPAARLLSVATEAVARGTGRTPLIPRGQLQVLLWQARPRTEKAQRELGWRPLPLAEGVRRTIEAAGEEAVRTA